MLARSILALPLAGLAAWPTVAWADIDDAAADEDIVVTAQKREQKPGDVGIALSVAGPERLRLAAGQDEAAIARQIPGLRVQSFSPSITIFNMRGVSQNDYSDAQEGPIAFYEDEVYVSVAGAIAGRAFDLARIEALRGPQGTLFGRNATGGLVQYVTARPTDRPELRATFTLASHRQFASEGAVSGPLGEGLRARLAWSTDFHRGYFRNRAGPDVGNSRFYAARLQLAADVASSGTLMLKLQGLRNDRERSAGYYAHDAAAPDALGLGVFLGPGDNRFGTCGGCDVLGYREPDSNPFTVGYNDPIRFDRKLGEAMARYEGALGSARLTAIADYQHLVKDYAEDSDMSPYTFLTAANYQRLDQWFGEVRVAGERGGLRWLAGLNGLDVKSYDRYRIDAANSAGLVEDYGGTLTTRSLAVFGQAELALAPRWTAIAGARFTHDAKRYDFTHRENGTIDLVLNPATYPGFADRNFDDWSGKLQIDYRPTAGVLLYAGLDRGTKSGGFSAPAVLPLDIGEIGFEPERLTSVSGGIKARVWGGKGEVSFAAFHYIYDRYQAFENADGYTLSVHNKDARITGVEFEGSVAPAAGLTLKATAAWLHSRILRVVLPSGDVRDRRMPNAPGFSATAYAAWRRAVPGGSVKLATSWRYEGAQYLTPFNAAVDRVAARLVGDARLSWRSSRMPIAVALFANNVTNRRYRLFDIDFSQNFGFVQSTYARPRWIGASVTFGS